MSPPIDASKFFAKPGADRVLVCVLLDFAERCRQEPVSSEIKIMAMRFTDTCQSCGGDGWVGPSEISGWSCDDCNGLGWVCVSDDDESGCDLTDLELELTGETVYCRV